MIGAVVFRPGNADALVQAAREMAWRSGLDVNAMDALVRRVAGQAQRRAVAALTQPGANDDD